MPVIIDERSRRKLEANKRKKLGHPVKPHKKSEKELAFRMNQLWKDVLLPHTDKIVLLIKDGAPAARIAEELDTALRLASMQYSTAAHGIMDKWRMSVDQDTRWKLQDSLRTALGIDLSLVLDTPEVKDALAVGGMEMANLIKTIPSEHLGKIARAVADNFAGKELPEGRSLIQQIRQLSGVTEKRAKLIARDQTSKLTGMLNQTRQQSIGIEEYIWRTVKDQRVVGNPNGLYTEPSKAHGDHYHRDGKTFRWDSPPEDGHPGQAIQCRCHAQPVIDPAKIVSMAQAA